MQRLHGDFRAAPRPRLGCPSSQDHDRATHALTWDGWWQSGNPLVAIPRWRCVCGQRFTDAPNARWCREGKLGPIFHAEDGSRAE